MSGRIHAGQTYARKGAWSRLIVFALSLDQLQFLEAFVAVLTNNDVVVHGNAERLGDLHDRLRHLDVRAGRRGVA